MILQSLQFIFFCVFYQILVRISKRLFPSMTLCTSLMRRALLSTLKLLRKSDRSTETGITFPDPMKNPSAFPATINITLPLISSIAVLSLWTHTIFGTWFQQPWCHSTTLLIDTLRPISTLNQKLTNLEKTQIRCSLHCERRTVKEKDCPSPLLPFKEITYRMDEWTKQLPRLEIWVNSGNPEQWTDFRQLWWTAIVFKCSYLFQLFDFYCLLVHYMFLFGRFTVFVLFPWSVWIRSKSLSTTSMQGNTPLGSWIRNTPWYIAEVHPGVNHRWTPSSATTPYNLLQYLIRSLLR